MQRLPQMSFRLGCRYRIWKFNSVEVNRRKLMGKLRSSSKTLPGRLPTSINKPARIPIYSRELEKQRRIFQQINWIFAQCDLLEEDLKDLADQRKTLSRSVIRAA
jgi:hypothetical protein